VHYIVDSEQKVSIAQLAYYNEMVHVCARAVMRLISLMRRQDCDETVISLMRRQDCDETVISLMRRQDCDETVISLMALSAACHAMSLR
jgi:hypothetical protein